MTTQLGGFLTNNVDEVEVDEEYEPEGGNLDHGVVVQLGLVAGQDRLPVHVDGPLPLVGYEEVTRVAELDDTLWR